MSISAKVIADSISQHGKRIITFQLKYPRFIHAEAKTHRVINIGDNAYELSQEVGFMDDKNLSRNASSSRAIPVAKMIEQVRNDPAKPIHWGANQPGMQARAELTGQALEDAQDAWTRAAFLVANIAEEMQATGLHKQVANRILETFQYMHVIVTATEWDNFYELRDHGDAEPNIRRLAQVMKAAQNKSVPKLLLPGQWHLPYVSDSELLRIQALAGDYEGLEQAKKASGARCARVSYLTHDGAEPSLAADIGLYERLVGGRPLHASPIEHQATPDQLVLLDDIDDTVWACPELHGNFKGWIQNRKIIEREFATPK